MSHMHNAIRRQVKKSVDDIGGNIKYMPNEEFVELITTIIDNVFSSRDFEDLINEIVK